MDQEPIVYIAGIGKTSTFDYDFYEANLNTSGNSAPASTISLTYSGNPVIPLEVQMAKEDGSALKYAVKYKVGSSFSIGIYDRILAVREKLISLTIANQLLSSDNFVFRMIGSKILRKACTILVLYSDKIYFWD